MIRPSAIARAVYATSISTRISSRATSSASTTRAISAPSRHERANRRDNLRELGRWGPIGRETEWRRWCAGVESRARLLGVVQFLIELAILGGRERARVGLSRESKSAASPVAEPEREVVVGMLLWQHLLAFLGQFRRVALEVGTFSALGREADALESSRDVYVGVVGRLKHEVVDVAGDLRVIEVDKRGRCVVEHAIPARVGPVGAERLGKPHERLLRLEAFGLAARVEGKRALVQRNGVHIRKSDHFGVARDVRIGAIRAWDVVADEECGGFTESVDEREHRDTQFCRQITTRVVRGDRGGEPACLPEADPHPIVELRRLQLLLARTDVLDGRSIDVGGELPLVASIEHAGVTNEESVDR